MPRPQKLKVPHPMDVKLGARIREVREQRDFSQESVAIEAGISVQQMQKYEKGHNRIAFSRIVELAKALDVSVPILLRPLFRK